MFYGCDVRVKSVETGGEARLEFRGYHDDKKLLKRSISIWRNLFRPSTQEEPNPVGWQITYVGMRLGNAEEVLYGRAPLHVLRRTIDDALPKKKSVLYPAEEAEDAVAEAAESSTVVEPEIVYTSTRSRADAVAPAEVLEADVVQPSSQRKGRR